MQHQFIAARTVAEALAALPAVSDAELPEALTTESARPREESIAELATTVAARRNVPVKKEGVLDRSDHDAALIADCGLLPDPGTAPAGPTFGEGLSES